MNVKLHNTTKIVTVDGVQARVWEGATEQGVEVIALIYRISARADADLAEFERDLQEMTPPSIAVEDMIEDARRLTGRPIDPRLIL